LTPFSLQAIRYTLVTELAESGAGDEVIMSIAGHVSRAMLSRYSHVRMEAKRRALDEISARQRAADEKRQNEAVQKQQAAVTFQSSVVQLIASAGPDPCSPESFVNQRFAEPPLLTIRGISAATVAARCTSPSQSLYCPPNRPQ
jgi:hypothetical protein